MTIPAARRAESAGPAGSAGPAATGLPWQVLDDYRCFGCSPHNPHGIQLTFAEQPDGLQTRFRLGRGHESYPGVVHGGLIGVICDETMGNLIVLRSGLVAFTTGMRLRYLAPAAVGESYTCRARLVDRGGVSDLVHASAEIADAAGDLVASATASYRAVPFGTARHRIALTGPEADRLDRALSATSATSATTPAPASSAPDVPATATAATVEEIS